MCQCGDSRRRWGSNTRTPAVAQDRTMGLECGGNKFIRVGQFKLGGLSCVRGLAIGYLAGMLIGLARCSSWLIESNEIKLQLGLLQNHIKPSRAKHVMSPER